MSLQDFCREGWHSLYSEPTATYTAKREELRQELLPLADMLDLQIDSFEAWPNAGTNMWMVQDLSFEFNPHSARCADALLEIGYHADELALAGFSEHVVGRAAVAALMELGHHASNQGLFSRIEAGYYSGFIFAFALLHEDYKPVDITDLGFSKPAVKRATAALLEGNRDADTLQGVSCSELVVQHVLLCMGFGAKDLRRARLSEASRDTLDFAKRHERRRKHLQRRNPNAPCASRGPTAFSSSVGKHRYRVGLRQHQQFDAFRRTCKCNLIAEAKREQREHNCRSE